MAPKRNTIKSHGYIPCTPMRDMAKGTGENKRYKRQTPFELTTNELLKKLCVKGPEGCGKQCDNWDVCLYGKAIVERVKDMKVTADITLNKGEHITRYFLGWDDLCVWMERHHDHIIGIKANLRKASEIRQGMENNAPD